MRGTVSFPYVFNMVEAFPLTAYVLRLINASVCGVIMPAQVLKAEAARIHYGHVKGLKNATHAVHCYNPFTSSDPVLGASPKPSTDIHTYIPDSRLLHTYTTIIYVLSTNL